MEPEVGIREQLEYCISLEELAAKLRIASATKVLAENIESLSKTVEKIRQNSRTSKKDKEKVDKVISEYKIRIGEMKSEYFSLLKQSETKIQNCESKEVECISTIAQMQQGSKEFLVKQRKELKQNYANKVEQAKELKNTDPVIMYLRAKKMLEDVKRNSVLYMDIKEYEKTYKIFMQAQQNEEVKKYLDLMEEIPVLKKDIKYMEKAKSEIQEYDEMIKQISKLKKENKVVEANKLAEKVKKIENESSVIQEYKAEKEKLKEAKKGLETAREENAKLKAEYKKQPENIRLKYLKKIKETNNIIATLQNKEAEYKENLKQYRETDTENFKRDIVLKQKRLVELKNSPDLEIYFRCEKDLKKKERNSKLFNEAEAYITAKDDMAKAKMNTNVAEYLSLLDEIAQLKVQIKESKQGKSTNIIKEYEDALKSAKKFGKSGRMNEYKEAMRVVREKESNATVQEYKSKKAELTTIQEELENAQNSRAGAIVEMNTKLDMLLRPAEQSLAVIEKINPVKKFFTNIAGKLSIGGNTQKNVISPIMNISNKLMEISQGIRENAEKSFKRDVAEIFRDNDYEKCSILEIVEKCTSRKNSEARKVNPLKLGDRQDTKVFQKNTELGFAR